MSSSPSICASPNFTFPASSKDVPQDYFGVSVVKGSGNKRMEQPNYFNHGGVVEGGPRSHKGFHEAISSLTSNTSDLTCHDSGSTGVRKASRTHSLVSTDTLVDDGGSTGSSSDSLRNKNKLRLSLSGQSHTHNQSLKGVNESSLYVFSEAEEHKASSAIEPSFDFDRISTANTSMEPHSYELENRYDREDIAFKAPVLRKHPTDLGLDQIIPYGNIPQDMSRPMYFSKIKQEPNYKDTIEGLSSQIRYISLEQAESYIMKTEYHDKLPNMLIIDVRPFTDYVKSHIKDSINVCLPSTLLKRSNFNLIRCIKSLPLYEKLLFNNYVKTHELNKANGTERKSTIPGGKFGLPAVLLYDNHNNSSNLFHFCKKFLNGPIWDKTAPIFLLDSNFQEFEARFPHLIESGKSEKINIAELHANLNEHLSPVMEENLKLRSSSVTEIPSYARNSDRVTDRDLPSLSNFKLPSGSEALFKIRHNEELLTSTEFSRSTIDLKNDFRHSWVPSWLKGSLMDEQKLNHEFLKLERLEQKRLLGALSLKANIEGAPKISGGIEYGHKNRYKDILVYEHSRVKLVHSPYEEPDDYINASYLYPISELNELTDRAGELEPHLKYIATQGPLDTTIGDFWKCILRHKTGMIISLTSETENGVMKCSPFWISGSYVANKDTIRVELSEESRYNKSIIIRTFNVAMNDTHFHKVVQVHLLSWPDMGSVQDIEDLIDIILLKNYLIKSLNVDGSNFPSLIHCSAGCGRTGVLCSADTIVNILMMQGDKEFCYDPVFSIVENFRKQRISMVQNLRQYYLIYDIILKYLNDRNEGISSKLADSNIIHNFLSN